MTKQDQMIDRCKTHARVAARQAVMRGLDPSMAGAALIAEGFVLTHGIDIGRAANLVKHVNAYALEVMLCENIEQYRPALTEAELEQLRQRSRANQNTIDPMVVRDLATRAAERAALMGASALPPNDWAPSASMCPLCGGAKAMEA
jgi:hypothetical protein